MGALRFSSYDQSTDKAVELYGYITLPKSGHHDNAVLLCNPFGQEAIRTHRLYRILTDRLAKAGIASLRFDYFGTGDSDGDDDHAPMSLQTCIKNCQDADLFLRETAKTDNVSWFGLRFGTVVAALASAATPLTPDRLFLWDPIDNGLAWLAALREDHAKALELMMLSTSTKAPPTDQLLGFESQGYRVTAPLAKYMAGFELVDYQKLKCARLMALAAGANKTHLLKDLDRCEHINSFELVTVEPAHWNSDEAMNTSIVPQDVINCVVREMAASGL